MFFVGATGQILTLLLSVFLPLLFFISGQQKTDSPHLLNHLPVIQRFEKIPEEKITTDIQQQILVFTKVDRKDYEVNRISKCSGWPVSVIHFCFKNCHLISSGNKAPPALVR